MDVFAEFEKYTFENDTNIAFLNPGYVKAQVIGKHSDDDKEPYLQFFYIHNSKQKRIAKKEAQELIEKCEDWRTRLILRKDEAATELAQKMAEKFTQSDFEYEDGVTWPYLSETEKDQWRSLARWTLDELKKNTAV